MTKPRLDMVTDTLRTHQTELRSLGVAALYAFGSVARGEAGPDSDVDLFLDYDDPRFSLITLIGVEERIQALLGHKIDLMTRRGLHPRLRHEIEASAVQIF